MYAQSSIRRRPEGPHTDRPQVALLTTVHSFAPHSPRHFLRALCAISAAFMLCAFSGNAHAQSADGASNPENAAGIKDEAQAVGTVATGRLTDDHLRSAKSDSRIKITSYVGNDGSQWFLPYAYDSKNKEECTIMDLRPFTKYGCKDAIYCSTSNNYDSPTFVNGTRASIACFDDFEESNAVGEYVGRILSDDELIEFYDNSVPQTVMHYERSDYPNTSGRQLFTDASCSSPLRDPVVQYSASTVDMNSVIREVEKMETITDAERVCMDGSVYEYEQSSSSQITRYYKPKQSSFIKVYEVIDSACTENTTLNHIILLEALPDSYRETILEKAKEKFANLCSELCDAINQEAEEEDWVEIHLVEAK